MSLLFQSYGEGPHFNEHDGLSSPFLGTGISGGFYQCLVGWSQSRRCRNCPMGCLKVAQARWAPLWPHQEILLSDVNSLLIDFPIPPIILFWTYVFVNNTYYFFSFVGKNERGPYSSFGGQVSSIKSKSNYWKCFSHLLDNILWLLIQIRKPVVPYSRGSCLQTLPCLLQMPCPHPDWSLAHNSTLHTPTTPGDAPQMEAWVKNIHHLLDLCWISQYWKKKSTMSVLIFSQIPNQKRSGSRQDCHLQWVTFPKYSLLPLFPIRKFFSTISLQS